MKWVGGGSGRACDVKNRGEKGLNLSVVANYGVLRGHPRKTKAKGTSQSLWPRSFARAKWGAREKGITCQRETSAPISDVWPGLAPQDSPWCSFAPFKPVVGAWPSRSPPIHTSPPSRDAREHKERGCAARPRADRKARPEPLALNVSGHERMATGRAVASGEKRIDLSEGIAWSSNILNFGGILNMDAPLVEIGCRSVLAIR